MHLSIYLLAFYNACAKNNNKSIIKVQYFMFKYKLRHFQSNGCAPKAIKLNVWLGLAERIEHFLKNLIDFG